MKKKSLIFIALLFCLSGCQIKKENKILNESIKLDENLMSKYILNNGKYLYTSQSITYNGMQIQDAINDGILTIENFTEKLELNDVLNDGGTKLYHYDKINNFFGEDDFYAIICNNIYNKSDIYISDNREKIINNCTYNVNKVDGVTIKIKDNSLTQYGVSVIITDINSDKNGYGYYYKLEKKVGKSYEEIIPLSKEYKWLTKEYKVGENNTLEFKINWSSLYGSLSSGTYRLLKEVNNDNLIEKNYIAVEFTIDWKKINRRKKWKN